MTVRSGTAEWHEDVESGVTGIGERQFQACADEAKRVCPVSRALAGIPAIVLTAKLAAGQ